MTSARARRAWRDVWRRPLSARRTCSSNPRRWLSCTPSGRPPWVARIERRSSVSVRVRPGKPRDAVATALGAGDETHERNDRVGRLRATRQIRAVWLRVSPTVWLEPASATRRPHGRWTGDEQDPERRPTAPRRRRLLPPLPTRCGSRWAASTADVSADRGARRRRGAT
jgi:hypothetical protein